MAVTPCLRASVVKQRLVTTFSLSVNLISNWATPSAISHQPSAMGVAHSLIKQYRVEIHRSYQFIHHGDTEDSEAHGGFLEG